MKIERVAKTQIDAMISSPKSNNNFILIEKRLFLILYADWLERLL